MNSSSRKNEYITFLLRHYVYFAILTIGKLIPDYYFSEMKHFLLFLFFVILCPTSAWSQVMGKVVDASDNTPLPFATILGKKTYAISNEEGAFKFNGKEGDLIEVSYLGYRDTVLVAKKNMVIRMVNDGILSEQVVITDENYISPYELLIKAKKRYKSLDQKVVESKLFVKRETINNGIWSDQTETLYNTKQYKGQIYDLSFQHGKSYVNGKNDLIFTLDLLSVLQEEELFSKYSKYLYTSACSLGSAKKIKKNYQGNYKEWQSNGKEYYIVDTESKIENKFDSELTISVEDYDLIRLKQNIKKPSETAFRSLLSDEPIDLNSLSLEYVFEEWEGIKVISTLAVKYDYHLNGVHSENIINLKFFDHGQPYYNLISSMDYDQLTDYQRIWNTPYNDEFWNGQKLTFSKLDTLSDFEDLKLESSNLMLRKRYLTLSDVKDIGTTHFVHVPHMDDGSKAMLKFDPMDMKTQRHLHANFFAHVYAIDNKPKVKIIPLIDHHRSFIMKLSPMMDSLFMKELKVVEATTQEAIHELESNPIEEERNPYKSIKKLINQSLTINNLSNQKSLQSPIFQINQKKPQTIKLTTFSTLFLK